MKIPSALLVLALLLSGCGAETSNDIAVTELPAQVRSAIDAQYPGARYVSAERETEDGVAGYEVEIEHNGQTIELNVTEDGRVTVD